MSDLDDIARPVLHLTNWSSRKLHRGTVYTIMRRPNPQHGQLGAGRVEVLTPSSMDFDALMDERISGHEYRRRFEAGLVQPFADGLLGPGRLTAITARGMAAGLVHDGDTLCCVCSRADAAEGWCHRVWCCAPLVRAGWDVVLDGSVLGGWARG